MSEPDLFQCEKLTIKGRENAVSERGARALARRTSQKWIELLLEQGVKPPIAILAEIYSETVESLSARLDCSPLVAENMRLDAANKAGKFWHDTPAQSVELPDGRTAIFMPMVMDGKAAAYVGGQLVAIDPPPDIKAKLEAQRLIPAHAPKPGE